MIWHSSPVIGSDGTVYVGSLDKKLYAVNSTLSTASADWPVYHNDPKHWGRSLSFYVSDAWRKVSNMRLTAIPIWAALRVVTTL